MNSVAYLSGLQVYRVQPSVVVLDLDGPGVAVVVVLVRDVHDGGHHVSVGLRCAGNKRVVSTSCTTCSNNDTTDNAQDMTETTHIPCRGASRARIRSGTDGRHTRLWASA
jgi:hypothetical protein